jgi:hypothetical protein
MLYLLPRQTFRRTLHYPGGPPSDEWASESPVRPVARIPIDPADFPFADQIGGHDDGDLIRYEELADLVEEALVGAEVTHDGYELKVAPGQELRSALDEYRDLGARLFPDINREIGNEDGEVVAIRVSGPPAYLHVLESQLSRRGLID